MEHCHFRGHGLGFGGGARALLVAERRARCTRRSGFTLIELLVTIAISAILATIAIPSFRSTVLNNRRAATANDFVSALIYARSLALSRHVSVTICRSSTPMSAAPTCGTGTGWESGWLVFADTNASGTAGAFDTGEEILRQHEALNGQTLRGETAPSARITFNSSGVTAQAGRLALCDSRGWTNDARVVILGGGGQIRTVPKAEDPSAALSGCTPS